MKKKLLQFKANLLLLLLVVLGTGVSAQVTVTINATGTAGSYKTGSVNSGGTKNDGLMTDITQLNNRGWAVFDLSSIPSGSVVNSVNLKFYTTSNSVLSFATNFIGGYPFTAANDPATVTGSTLYTLLDASLASNFDASTWNVNNQESKTLNAGGVTFIANNLGGSVVMSFVRGSTNSYEIYGYDAPSAAQQPQLEVTFIPSTPCAGVPVAGTANGPASVCPGVPFNLNVSGFTAAGGITFQWEESPAGANTWTAIAGATTSTYNVAGGITAATDYRVVVTCTNGGATDVSSVAAVAMNPFYNCYCTSGATNNFDGEIFNVTFAGMNNSSTCPGLSPSYADYTATVTPPVVMQTAAVPFSVNAASCGGSFGGGLKIFIDYNQNGLFTDVGEEAFFQGGFTYTPAGTIISGMVTIPVTAMTGLTRMRVIMEEGGGSGMSPCGTYGYGETEDYLIDIVAATPCAGTPVAGTASAPSSLCANSSFTLSLTGYTVGTGITIQWEESPSGANTWVAIAGATNAAYMVAAGITAATDYRAVVTCTNGGFADISNTVTVSPNPFYLCYCSPNTGVQLNDGFATNYITNVEIPNTTLNNNTTATPGVGGYNLFWPTTASTTGDLTQTAMYTINVTHEFSGYYSDAWIDFDGSGTFDASEFIDLTTSNLTATGTFVVPVTAVPGLTGMRVRLYWMDYSSGDACATFMDYETEDYIVNIVAATPCAGIPTPGTAGGPASVCSGNSFNLSLTGYTLGTGITIQWEESPAGANTWTAISGATAPVYTVGGIFAATDYRAVVTCTNGGFTDISNVHAVAISPFYLCYCGPNTGVTLNDGFQTNYLTNVTIPTTTLNNTTTTQAPGAYSLFWPTTPATTADIMQGVQYTLNTTHQFTFYYSDAWIDFDGNGVFDNSEFVDLTTTGTNATGTFLVPLNAVPGLTGMRVRLYWMDYSAGDACASFMDYETEDYVITIVAAPPCGGQPVAGVASAPASACSGAGFNLDLTGYTVGTGITIQWEESPAGTNTWTAITGATNPTYNVSGGITAPMDYRAVVTCSNGGLTDISNTVSVTMSPFYSCYCTSAANNAFDGEITNVTFGSMNNSSTCAASNQLYTNFTSTVTAPQVMQGSTVPFSVTAGSCGGSFGGGLKIFIDYNQDGDFFDLDEEAFFQGGFTYTPAGFVISGNVIIPITALPGSTGMRVIMEEGGGIGMTPCGTYGYGETEDYAVEIVAAVGCTGTPVAGTASGPANICAGVGFNLTLTGYTIASGITIQWEESPAGANTWSAIPGATSATYSVASQVAATDYRAVVTCTNGGLTDISNVVAVAQNLPNQCYCASNFTNVTFEHITNVTYAGINNTSAGNTGGPVDYTLQVGNVSPGVPDNISVTIQVDANEYVFAFIDWDQNGVLNDAGEVYTIASGVGTAGPHILSITPPVTALSGNTRMRVMLAYANAIPDPCLSQTYGEAEDYTLNVGAPPTCLPPTGLAAAVTGTSVDVSWNAVTGASGYEWAIDQTNTPAPNASTLINTSATTTPPTYTGLSSSTTYYLHVRTDCGAVNGLSSWAAISFATPPPNDECVNAIDISNSLLLTGTTAGATQSQAACDATVLANDVWYSFTTGSVGGPVTVTVITTGVMDVVIQGFQGTCGSLTAMVPTASTTVNVTCVDGPAAGTEFATYTTLANTTYYIRVYGFNSLQGSFTIQATGTPLTVELGNISATNVGSRNRVDWNTLSEHHGDYFMVERSVDAVHFTALGRVDGKGLAASYSYWDENPVTGVNHYRLKMLDASGSFTYSEVVKAVVKGSGKFTVEAYPNPVGNEMLQVQVYGQTADNASVTVSDVTGKVIKVVSVVNNKAEINMTSVAQGVYLVRYSDAVRTETIKVNKQ